MQSRRDLRHLINQARHHAHHVASLCHDRAAYAWHVFNNLPQTKRLAGAPSFARAYVIEATADLRRQGSHVMAWLSAELPPRLAPAIGWGRRGTENLVAKLAELSAPSLQFLAAQPSIRRVLHALPLVRSCIAVAAANLLEQRLRLVAALSGVAVALFLLILQISVLDATRAKVTALFDDFKFDMVILPDTYQFLLSFDTVNRIVLDIARATGDVGDTFGLNVGVVHWTQLPSKRETYNFLIGLDDPSAFAVDREIRDGWAQLVTPRSILADRYSQDAVGPVTTGTTAQISQDRVTIAGQFRLGLFFYAEGAAIVRNTNFARLAGRDSQMISMGLLQLKPGISPAKAKADLIRALPSDTLVLTRNELLRDERAYFLTTKPIGVMILISMIIACLVAVVIIIQVLSTDISNRMNEYAVLKAMGANLAFVYGVGMVEAALLGFGGLLPAAVIGALVLAFVQVQTHLMTALDLKLATEMIVITLVLATSAGIIVVRRVQYADPAELY